MEHNILLIHEATPNPNSVRIISNLDFRDGKSATFFKDRDTNIPLVKELFQIEGIKEIFLLDNFITITKESVAKWDNILKLAKERIEKELPFHDPCFKDTKQKRKIESKDIEKIDKILDKYIRSSLRSDGGDLEIVSLIDNVLTIRYEGACGSCPSAISVTLESIQSLLRKEYSAQIIVDVAH